MPDFSFDTPQQARVPDTRQGSASEITQDIADRPFTLDNTLGQATGQLKELNEEAFVISASARDVFGVYQDQTNQLADDTGVLLDEYREAKDSVFHDLIASFTPGGRTTNDIRREIQGQSVKQIQIQNKNKKAQRGYAELALDVQRRVTNINLTTQGQQLQQDARYAELNTQQQGIILENARLDKVGDAFSLAQLQEQASAGSSKEFTQGQLEIQILRKIAQRNVVKKGMSKEKDPLKQAKEDAENAEFLFGTLNIPSMLAHKDIALQDRANGGQGVARLQIPNLQTNHKVTLQQIEKIMGATMVSSAEVAGADPRFSTVNADYDLSVNSLITTTDRAFEGLYDVQAKEGQILLDSVPPQFAGDFAQVNRLNISSQGEMANGNIEGSLRDRSAAAAKMAETRTKIIDESVKARAEDQQPAYREYLEKEGYIGDPQNARDAIGAFMKQSSSANLSMPTEIRTVMDTMQREFQSFIANRTNLVPEISTGEGGQLLVQDLSKAREQEFFDSIFSKRYLRDPETGKVISAPSDAEKGATFGIVDMMRAAYAVNYNKFVIATLSQSAPDLYAGLLDSTGRPRRAFFSNTTNLIKGLIAIDARRKADGEAAKDESLLRTFVQTAQNPNTFSDYRGTQFSMTNSFPSANLNVLMFGNKGDSQLEALYLGALARIDFQRVATELSGIDKDRFTTEGAVGEVSDLFSNMFKGGAEGIRNIGQQLSGGAVQLPTAQPAQPDFTPSISDANQR